MFRVNALVELFVTKRERVLRTNTTNLCKYLFLKPIFRFYFYLKKKIIINVQSEYAS